MKKGISFYLKIPVGYNISVAAEGLRRPRFFSKSPDGKLFVTDLYNKDDNNKGRVILLDAWNEKTKCFDSVITYANNLHNPNQVLFITAGGQQLLFIAETDQLASRPYNPNDKEASSNYKVIAQFPAYGLNYKYGGWHLTRSLCYHNSKLYVSIGSSCNACIEKEEMRAVILEMDVNGGNSKIFARGLRNSVAIKWVGNELWATNMGRDLIGPDKPEDLLQTIHRDGFYGWPFYYQYKNKIEADKDFSDSAKNSFVKNPHIAEFSFKAHSAPLGFDFFANFSDSLLDKSFLVALHGSTSVWRQRGNAVVQMLPGGSYRDIVSGFLQGKTEDKRFGRPCDVIQWNSNSFFISDDKNGVIYYVWKE